MRKILTVILLIVALLAASDATAKRKTSKKKANTSQKVSKKKKTAVSKEPVVITEHYDGIDVSSHQKDIDWAKVSKDKNIRFVYIKATEGATYVSPHYERNLREAKKVGIKVGSYHFMRTTTTMQEQFENFKRVVKPEEQDLLPLIDFENRGNWTPQQMVDSLTMLAGLFRDYYHCEPMIYTSSNFYNKYLSPHFDNYPLFIARYHDEAPRLTGDVPYTLWQFTESAKLDGVVTAVDMSRFANGKELNDILINAVPAFSHAHTGSDIETPSTDVDITVVPTTVDETKLTKEQRRQLEKERKEAEKQRKNEQRRLKKEREQRQKDSIRAEKQRQKAERDSIKALRKQEQMRAKSQQVNQSKTDNSSSVTTDDTSDDTQSTERGATYSSQYSTRRGKD